MSGFPEQHEHRGFYTRHTYPVDAKNYDSVASYYKAGGILFYRFHPEHGQLQVLLGLEKRNRVAGLKDTPFFLHPIGGRIDRDIDPTMMDTCIREFREETGELLGYESIKAAVTPPAEPQELEDPHAPICIYMGQGKYVMYLAPYLSEKHGLDEKIDQTFNHLRSDIANNIVEHKSKCLEELSAITWVDWDWIQTLFIRAASSESMCANIHDVQNGGPTNGRLPTLIRNSIMVIEDEQMRRTLIGGNLYGPYAHRNIHRQVVVSEFAFALLGNAHVVQEMKKRSFAPFL